MSDESIERLESRIAYLESAGTELSDVVYRQQKEIDALRAQVATLTARLQSIQQEAATPYTAEDERPPHY